MSRLHPRDAALLAVMLPIWLTGFALQLRVLATDSVGAWPGVVVSSPARGDYPVVVAHQPWPESSSFALGDRLLRVGEANLRDVGPVGFAVRARAEAAGDLTAPIEYERGGIRRVGTLRLRPTPSGWALPLIALSWALTGLLVILRAPRSLDARAFLPAAFSFSFLALLFHGGPARATTYAWIAVHTLTFAFAGPLLLRWAAFTPEEVAPRPPRTPRWAFLFSAMAITFPSFLVGWPLPHALGLQGQFILGGSLSLAILGVLARNFRRASPVGRRRIKWILYGIATTAIPMSLGALAGVLEPAAWFAGEVAWIGLAATPLFVWIAITRYNAFDIDRVISATASYSLVVATGFALLLGGIPFLAQRLGLVTGTAMPAMQAALGVLLAACVVPAHRALHPRLEQLFFTAQSELQHGMEQLLQRLPEHAGPRELFALVGEQLDLLFRPTESATFVRDGGEFVPAFASGESRRTGFLADGALVAALRGSPPPLAAERGGRRREPLGAFERAALQELHAEVVVPIGRGSELSAFVALGPKRSGDVYTPTDLALLAALAQTIVSDLKRHDADAALRQGREIEDRMRRYIPGAVADQIASGRELASEAREASVLFVDVRGYSKLSASRSPEQIFEAVNRYTEAVTRVVRDQGGTVVEFNGDGMMAIFGAPEPLEHKERAAVEAAREISERVGEISIGMGAEAAPLSVGVGIATGAAYVGNLRAADRLIWTALGNVTNLASRLQALSRDLHAAIVIDAPTRRGARYVASDFVHHPAVAIRGLGDPEDLWVLPLVRGPREA